MSKTIEERADDLYTQYSINGVKHELLGKSDYVKGANDQQKIDIDKACEWLFNNFYLEQSMVDCIAYKHEDEDINVMIAHFKKAMED